MFRRLSFILFSICLLNFFAFEKAYANFCGCCPFDGFYFGVAGGVATNKSHVDAFTSVRFLNISVASLPEQPQPVDLLTEEFDTCICQIKPWGEIFAGWGFCTSCMPWLYLGGRVGANFSCWDIKHSSLVTNFVFINNSFVTLDTAIKTRLSTAEFTFDFKPGFVWCDLLLYGLVGGAVHRDELKANSEFIYQGGGIFFNELRLKKEHTSVGFRIGAGLEKMFCDCLSLYVSYVYTFYPKLSVNGTANVTSSLGTVANGYVARYSIEPRRQVTSIGLAYYF